MKRVVSIFCAILVLCLGASCSASPSGTETAPREAVSSVVYITEHGERYHRSNCSSLWNSKIETTIDKAIEGGYTPCKKCKPPTR